MCDTSYTHDDSDGEYVNDSDDNNSTSDKEYEDSDTESEYDFSDIDEDETDVVNKTMASAFVKLERNRQSKTGIFLSCCDKS